MPFIDASLLLPTWRGRDILWLQMESLCRQATGRLWELIVAECPSEAEAGRARVESYGLRLHRAGCRRLVYVRNEERVPLALKWSAMARLARSGLSLLCASDNYSPPSRIEATARAFDKGADFFAVESGLFLNIETLRAALWQRRGSPTALFMAAPTHDLAGLALADRADGIDQALVSAMRPTHPAYLDGPLGLHTDGCNTISRHRSALYDPVCRGDRFGETALRLSDVVPPDIERRLRRMAYRMRGVPAHQQVNAL